MIPTSDVATRAPVLTPPRPNLGPLPLDESLFTGEIGARGIAVLVAVAVAMLVAAYLMIQRLRRRRAARAAKLHSMSAHPPNDPRGQLIPASERVREALVARFGPAWHARTTEEIEAGPELAATCGPDDASRLITLLRDADRAKFDGDRRSDASQGKATDTDWPWLDGALTALASASAPAATPKSRINGK